MIVVALLLLSPQEPQTIAFRIYRCERDAKFELSAIKAISDGSHTIGTAESSSISKCIDKLVRGRKVRLVSSPKLSTMPGMEFNVLVGGPDGYQLRGILKNSSLSLDFTSPERSSNRQLSGPFKLTTSESPFFWFSKGNRPLYFGTGEIIETP